MDLFEMNRNKLNCGESLPCALISCDAGPFRLWCACCGEGLLQWQPVPLVSDDKRSGDKRLVAPPHSMSLTLVRADAVVVEYVESLFCGLFVTAAILPESPPASLTAL